MSKNFCSSGLKLIITKKKGIMIIVYALQVYFFLVYLYAA